MSISGPGDLRVRLYRAVIPSDLGEAGRNGTAPSPNWSQFAVHYRWTPHQDARIQFLSVYVRRDRNASRITSINAGFEPDPWTLLKPGDPWRYPKPEDAIPVVEAFGRSLVNAVPGTELKLTRTGGGGWNAVFRMTSVWNGYQDPAGMDIQMDLRTGLISTIRFEGAFPNIGGMAPGELLSEEEMAASSALELLRQHYGPVLRTGTGQALGILRNPDTGELQYWPIHQFVYEELTEDGKQIKPGGKWWFGSVNAFTGETRVTLTEGRPGGPQAPREIPAFVPDDENATLIVLGKRLPATPTETPLEFQANEIGWFSVGDRLLPLQIDDTAGLARLVLGDEKRYFRLD